MYSIVQSGLTQPPTYTTLPTHLDLQTRLHFSGEILDDVEDSGTWIDSGTATTVTWYTLINIDNINITIVNSSIQHIHVNNI